MEAVKIYVKDERSIVRTIIDIQNLIVPEKDRIRDKGARVFEAFVIAYRQLGTINSLSSDTYIKEYINKPEMSKRSYKNYRNSLVKKGWMAVTKENYTLLPSFRLHNVRLSGVLASIYLQIERIE